MPDRVPPDRVSHLVFDVETVGDGALVSRVKYPDADLSPAAALARFRAQLLKEKGSDVLPVTFVRPCAVAVVKVAADGTLLGLASLDDPRFDPAAMTRDFWHGWRHYGRPTLVTFNGRSYDLPVMELGAFREGISLPDWFDESGPSYRHPRNRFNSAAHLDLMELLTNYGAARLSGGLTLLANLLGKPGRGGMGGEEVQALYDGGKVDHINRYCRCDVLDTYFVFLRTRVLTGALTLEEEADRVAAAREWLGTHGKGDPACGDYLGRWGNSGPTAED